MCVQVAHNAIRFVSEGMGTDNGGDAGNAGNGVGVGGSGDGASGGWSGKRRKALPEPSAM
jgi:hypothetical protein